MIQAQIHNHTSIGRITAELLTVRACLGVKRPKILSFGCSIGDEVATILSVFPDAEVFACDIYESVLDTAKNSVGHLAKVFLSNEENIQENDPYDIIIASAVLCLNPPNEIASRFPFQVFEQLIQQMDRSLKPGGVLILTNMSYRFMDTQISNGYDVIRSDVVVSSGFVDVFAPDGRVFLKQNRFLSNVVYSLGEAFALTEDEELTDSIFQKSREKKGVVSRYTISPVPETFVEKFHFTRDDADSIVGEVASGLILKSWRYRFGVDAATNLPGFAIQLSWPSVVHSGERHIKNELWKPLPF